MSSSDNEAIETVLRLVHDKPHVLVIEHLARLRSEGAVRGTIQAWAQHDTRNVFLMLIDMSQDGALDRGTYPKKDEEPVIFDLCTNWHWLGLFSRF